MLLTQINSSKMKLEEVILKTISSVKGSSSPSECHVYFMIGLCDLTYRDTYTEFVDFRRRRVHMYEEASFTEDNTNAVLRVTNLIDNMDKEIRSFGAKSCFLTIPPCSIEAWNFHRLNTGRTTHLIHHRNYPNMQANLIPEISNINKFIVSTNSRNNMATPFPARL